MLSTGTDVFLLYVIKNDLPYFLIGLPYYAFFQINIDCSSSVITQYIKVIPQLSIINENNNYVLKTFHVSIENEVKKIETKCENEDSIYNNCCERDYACNLGNKSNTSLCK